MNYLGTMSRVDYVTGLGESGYVKIFKEIMESKNYLEKEINTIPHLHVLGKPHGSVIAFARYINALQAN